MLTAIIAAAAIDYAAMFDKTNTLRNDEYDRLVDRIAASAPGLVKATELGKTAKGTPIRLLTVTDFSTGDERSKVGYYIQGHIHVKEMSGTPAALYLASRLAETHRPGGILEKTVFYIVPRCVPDGADEMAQTQGNMRSAWGELLTEGDSLIEPRDIDGDGKISQMVFEWPTSNLVRSPRDPRCFVHRARHPEIKGPFYSIMVEGVFHNWNGKPPKLPWPRYFWREYLDYNRNWEPGWSADTPGAGKAPLNVPETRLQADFLLSHRNIRFAIALHNGYGMVFVSRVKDECLPKYMAAAEKLSAMTGFPVLKEWEDHQKGTGVAVVKRSGFFTEFCYWKAGIPCLTMELGTVETSCGLDARDMFKRKDPYTAPYEVIAAEDAHPEFEKSWLPWKKVKHPQLGEVEVGGLLDTVFASPRPRDLEKTSERVFQFMLSHAADLVADAAKEAAGQAAARAPISLSADFPGGNVVVESQTEDTVRIRPDTRTSTGECAPRHWAFRVRGAGGRKIRFQFPHDPIFGFLSTRGPAVSRDDGVTWSWMTDGNPANPPESFEYAFGPDENDILFAWQPLYTEATLRRFVDRMNKAGAKISAETLCKTEKGRSAELLRIGNDANPGKVGVVLLARHHANETWASFVLQGVIGKILSESPDGSFLRENVSFFIVPFVDKDGVEDGDPGKDRKPHDHNRDYDKDRYSTIRAIKQKATEWARDKKIVLGFDLHSCSLEVRGRRLHNEKAWAHNMLFQLVRTTTRDEPSVRLFSGLLRRNHPNERSFIQYLPATDSIETGPVAKGSAAKSRDWMFSALDTKYVATLETPFARPDGRPNTPEAAEELGEHIAKTIADFVRETLAYAKKSLTAD